MKTSAMFSKRWLPLALAAPQLLIVFLFFYWPTIKAFWWSLYLVRPFGNGSVWVGLGNYLRVLSDESFYSSLLATFVFTAGSVGLSIPAALLVAGVVGSQLRGSKLLSNLFIWPYAVAGAVIGTIFRFVINPVVGPMSVLNRFWPGVWEPSISAWQAMLVDVIVFAWTQIPFNFVIFLAALNSVPEDYLAAAAIDGAGPVRRFFDIQVPIIAPFLVFATVITVLEAFTNSFGIIDALSKGGPGGATNILVYKIYTDGFVGLDLSGSSTLSVLMMLAVVGLTVVQFRWFERRLESAR